MLVTNNSKSIDIEKAVEYLKKYINTYPNQLEYRGYYLDKTYVDDILYRLGVSIDGEKYKWANGYRNFKKDLLEYLKNDLEANFTR